MAVKARGANFDSNHGYWVLTDKEYQDSQAKDTQIERLTKGLREITEMTVCDALGEPFHRAQRVAWDAIKEATT